MNIALWIAQIFLALLMISGAVMKFLPTENMAEMMPWMGEVSPGFVWVLGVLDLLAAMGLVLPALFKMYPKLTVVTAIAIIAYMIAAIIFHISRGEGSSIGVNIVAILLSGWIAWGRARKP